MTKKKTFSNSFFFFFFTYHWSAFLPFLPAGFSGPEIVTGEWFGGWPGWPGSAHAPGALEPSDPLPLQLCLSPEAGALKLPDTHLGI